MNARTSGSWRPAAWAIALVAMSQSAIAGRACEEHAPTEANVRSGLALAEAVQRSLDASGAQVVLLARVGQDLSNYGLTYSHLGYAYRETDASAPADVQAATSTSENVSPVAPAHIVWRIVNELNQCGTARSAVYRQGLGDFFLDDLFRYQAAYVVPTVQVQAALLPILRDNRRAGQWHTPDYSVVAYPWATRYQQSNQWALETLAGALEPAATTRARAQAWLQLHDYQPTVLHIGPLTRLGGRITKANVAFDDHPNAQRYTNHIETVTVDSMFTWLQRDHLASAPVSVE